MYTVTNPARHYIILLHYGRKTGIVEEDVAVARLRRGKYVSAATNQHARRGQLLEAVFSVLSAPKLYSEEKREVLV
jgi:hypothetical protein